MSFARKNSDTWRQRVPGVRWFKADLHIHTIDDHAGGRAKIPTGVTGQIGSPEMIAKYARRFLQGAVAKGIQVLGVTPHSPRSGSGPETSAVWRIVEEWNSGADDDGVPFRDKIFAVFPGFEPSLNDGRGGTHILFLFDPEIGRENYLKVFDLVMGGVSPWPSNELRMSGRDAEEAFDEIRRVRDEASTAAMDEESEWDYIVLAPHIEAEKGLLGAQRAQVLARFPHQEIAGLELADERLPENTIKDRPWLVDGMEQHHQSFFHSSDAYAVDAIGNRYTWFKLASPKIEALRQAFIASESRVRIAYERDDFGGLSPISDPPDVTMNDRPWLKSITVAGKVSFFGSTDESAAPTRIELSPDLTCIIGGSMTGKSTLLDGLRVHVKAPLPQDAGVKTQVEGRARTRFLTGSPEVVLECPNGDPTAPEHERWPAVFYGQGELQSLAQDPEAVEEILSMLVAGETAEIKNREELLSRHDRTLGRTARQFVKIAGDLADADQAFDRSTKATEELAAYDDAGVGSLSRLSIRLGNWQEQANDSETIEASLAELIADVGRLNIPQSDDRIGTEDESFDLAPAEARLRSRIAAVTNLLRSAQGELSELRTTINSALDTLKTREQSLSVQINRDLANQGFDGGRINQLQAINEQASQLETNRTALERAQLAQTKAHEEFEDQQAKRRQLVGEQRAAFDRVMDQVRDQFGGQIIARRIEHAQTGPLDEFVRNLGQRGITRWWNDLEEGPRPTPETLLNGAETNQLGAVGMSTTVQQTFLDRLTPAKKRELAALRCKDVYVLEFKMDDGTYRPLEHLSGGQRVNLLLTLLLETNDERPLVIDQPEDELDNRFLFDTMLPALKRLKGRRQIIVATHEADIVVNGDADQVIHLEATADHGRVANAGAIEEASIRTAIVRTVDGGDQAFEMRRLKYGF